MVPTDLLTYMLSGNAARVHCSMRVVEASNWEVVKAVLTTEFAMPWQEAWRKYVNCQHEAGETVDVYLGRLKRLCCRLGLTLMTWLSGSSSTRDYHSQYLSGR